MMIFDSPMSALRKSAFIKAALATVGVTFLVLGSVLTATFVQQMARDPTAVKNIPVVTPSLSLEDIPPEGAVVSSVHPPESHAISSALRSKAEGSNLFDGLTETFWHVAERRERRPNDWVTVDLGAGKERRVDLVRFRPRQGMEMQFFDYAFFQGSEDGLNWVDIAILHAGQLKSDNWVSFEIPNANKFRYYRLEVSQGHLMGRFYTLSEMELHDQKNLKIALESRRTNRLPVASDAPVIGRNRGKITASSSLPNHPASSAADGDGRTFWHVGPAPAKVYRLQADIGYKPQAAINYLRVRPRSDLLSQMFKSAWLLGSDDARVWIPIAKIESPEEPKNDAWQAWQFPAVSRFRHYQLRIGSGHSAGRFYSLAEFELYSLPEGEEWDEDVPTVFPAFRAVAANAKPLCHDRKCIVTASSFNSAREGEENAVDGNEQTYWHVAMQEAHTVEWLRFDLGQEKSVGYIRVLARSDEPNQIFDHALVSASDDGTNWRPVMHMNVEAPSPAGSWLTWKLPTEARARFVRLQFTGGFAGNRFASLSEAQLYAPGDLIAPTVIKQVAVFDVSFPLDRKAVPISFGRELQEWWGENGMATDNVEVVISGKTATPAALRTEIQRLLPSRNQRILENRHVAESEANVRRVSIFILRQSPL